MHMIDGCSASSPDSAPVGRQSVPRGACLPSCEGGVCSQGRPPSLCARVRSGIRECPLRWRTTVSPFTKPYRALVLISRLHYFLGAPSGPTFTLSSLTHSITTHASILYANVCCEVRLSVRRSQR